VLSVLGRNSEVRGSKPRSAKCKFCFTKARVTEALNYSLRDIVILEASSFKYLGIILRSDLGWADQANYTSKKAWEALHFTMRVVKKGNSNVKSLV
jgi:hypothetical protein